MDCRILLLLLSSPSPATPFCLEFFGGFCSPSDIGRYVLSLSSISNCVAQWGECPAERFFFCLSLIASRRKKRKSGTRMMTVVGEPSRRPHSPNVYTVVLLVVVFGAIHQQDESRKRWSCKKYLLFCFHRMTFAWYIERWKMEETLCVLGCCCCCC